MAARTVGEAGLTVRSAVRAMLNAAECEPYLRCGVVSVAVSGGADSLALAEATAHCSARLGLRTQALVVNHGLQEGSAEVARRAARQARALGIDEEEILTVEPDARGGPEAAARRARYAALRGALAHEGALVLLGHTRDDQAETVLLGLGRGSGPRSVAGMRPLDPPWARPLLDLPRSATKQACAELGVDPWHDPHNTDTRFTRSRLRTEVMPLLEDVLQSGVAAALARTATQLREDHTALDELADALRRSAALDRPAGEGSAGGHDGCDDLDAGTVAGAHSAVRRRALRAWLLDAGVREVSDGHLRSVEALVSAWRGQGGVWLPGNLVASRAHGRLQVCSAERGHTPDEDKAAE